MICMYQLTWLKKSLNVSFANTKIKSLTSSRKSTNFQKAYLDKDYEEDEEVKIIRTKKFGIKPMYPEDACVQMELLGHNFFVFYNAETEQVNVVYKGSGNLCEKSAGFRPFMSQQNQASFLLQAIGRII